jgi:hypothetical protein
MLLSSTVTEENALLAVDLTQLANLGEFIGGVAVLVTLDRPSSSGSEDHTPPATEAAARTRRLPECRGSPSPQVAFGRQSSNRALS